MSTASGPAAATALGCLLLVGGAAPAMTVMSPLAAQSSSLRSGEDVLVSASRSDVVHVEPTMAVSPADPSRAVIASMIVRRPRSEDFQDSWSVVVYATRDGGRTWHGRRLPGLSGQRVAGDPWIVWTEEDVVYLSCIVTRSLLRGEPTATWVYRSSDGGWTWSEPERGVFGSDGEVDHPVLTAADQDARSPSLYVVGTKTSGEDEGVRIAAFEPERKGFVPLDPFTVDRSGVNLGDAAALSGGELIFTYFQMRRPPYGLWSVRRSADGHWTETRVREAILPVGFPSLAVDRSDGPHRGRVYAVWVEGATARDQGDLRVLLSSSDDRGASWRAPVPVHSHARPTQRTLPSVAVNGDGIVGVSWMDSRNAGGRSDCTELWFAASADGGASFAPEVRVSDVPSCFGTPENGAAARRWKLGGGEYHGMSTDADGGFHVAWADSRTGIFQIWTSEIAPSVRRKRPSPGVGGAWRRWVGNGLAR